MRNKLFEMCYFNTYYYANIIGNILDDPFAYLRTIHELFENDGEHAFFEPFPKNTALHKFAEFCIDLEFFETLSAEQTDHVLRSERKLLPVNHAFAAYGMEHTTLAEWLCGRNKKLGDVDADDLCHYFYDLKLEQAYDDLLSRITDELFFIMFLNRGTLAALNLWIARYIADVELVALPPESRELFAMDGVLKRRTIPRWARRAVFFRDRGACALCNRDLSGMVAIDNPEHFDHIVPLAQGGINDVTNLQLLCGPCNLKKGGDRVPVSINYERWYPADA